MCPCQRSSEPSWHESSIKESVVDSLTIRQEDNTQKAILHFRYLHPESNSTISLKGFAHRCPDRSFNPLLSNNSAIRPVADRLEVTCDFHTASVADFRFAGSPCRITSAVNRAQFL